MSARAFFFGLAALLAPSPSHAQSAPSPSPSPSQREFEAATAREATGDFAGAADALERLGRARPDDPFAADALFEAAVIAEEHLSQPARAERLYREVLARYPQSRLARRANGRAQFLSSSLRSGEAPLVEYQDILGGHPRRPPAESIARMEKLLAEHPDFTLADRALFWLGNALVSAGRDDAADARYREIERRFPSSEWAGRATKARGDLALKHLRPFAARALFDELRRSTDPLARAAAVEGLTAVRTMLRRFVEAAAAIVYLIIFFAWHARALARRRRLLRAPAELWFYAPVAALFVLAAATEHRAIALATLAIAGGGALVVWLSGGLSAARLDEGPMRARERALHIAAAALAVLAIALIAVQATGLTDLVLETMRSGPER